MKKVLILFLSLTLVLGSFVGCSKTHNPNKNLDKKNIFFDDFSDGISKDRWNISNMKWGKDNGGVIYQNVGYTADGEVVLTSNGDLYAGDKLGYGNDHGRRAGGSIRTQKSFGPGRFEVKMKCLPRFGSTTAFWTFYNDGKSANHEIDIELNVNNNFEAVWNTNWLTEKSFDHYETETSIVNNDGEWHEYKFEWHTNPGRIDYYIDNILTHTSYSNIPTFSAPISIGNWFPDLWAGQPDFETDYTFLDWFRYTPYKNQPYDITPDQLPTEAELKDFYPTAPMEKPVANLISNAQFLGSADAWRMFGDNANIVKVANDNNVLVIGQDSVAVQNISGTHKDFEYRLTASAKGKGEILIETQPENTAAAIETFRLTFDNTQMTNSELVFKLTKAATRLKVSVLSLNNGEITVDKMFMNLTKIYKA